MYFILLDATSRDWFDYLRDIVTILGYIATVGTFIYLFRRDNDKQRQIDSLARLAALTEEQLILSVMPDLYKNGGTSSPGTGEITIDLLNRGENARLIEFNNKSTDVILHNEGLPYVLEKGEQRKIFARSTGKHPHDCEYLISVIYEDKLKNKYQIDISGKGASVRFDQAVLIKNRNSI